MPINPTHLNNALKAHASGDLKNARLLYQQVLTIDPENSTALGHLGIIEGLYKNIVIAENLLLKALSKEKNNPDFLLNYGAVLLEKNQYSDAIGYFQKAIRQRPLDPICFSNLASCYNAQNQPDLALRNADQSIQIKPDHIDAWFNRGISLYLLRRYDEALASYERTLTLKPDHIDAWFNRGISLYLLKRYDEALASYEQTLALQPDDFVAWCNRGTTLDNLKRYDEALASYERVLALKPDHVDAVYNKSIILLSAEHLQQGWELQRLRWDVKSFSESNKSRLQTDIAPWSENIKVKRLLVWAEQGIGDEIFYTNILAKFTPPEIEVTLAADKRLHPLLARSFPHIKLLDRRTLQSFLRENTFDAQVPIADLGRLLSVDKLKIQLNTKPYLKVNLERQEEYNRCFSDLRPAIICGLSWRSKREVIGSYKSLSLLKLTSLFNLKNIKFINLQYGDVSEEVEEVQKVLGIKIHINPNLDPTNDIDGLVSQINMCDMVVTTSNVTAHLAGAIGKKGVVLLPYSRGKIWYWHKGEGPSLWYPSLHLISQNKIDDWSECVDGATRWVKENM